ncbi:hypothetical protein R3P38DRAFT_2759140 [Favolaschia claudopus]|uniref:Uncharacterized protein n=1 Tax=Favolaschia claudopus TaxID=2862362 RepID=A0AAW0E4Y1_9AGAR
MYNLPVALLIWALCGHISSVNGYVRPRQGPSSAQLAAPAVVTPAFAFNSIPEMTTCSEATITWQYSPVTADDPGGLTLSITNENVAQPPAPSTTVSGTFKPPGSRGLGRRADIQRPIASSIDPGLRTFTWTSVDAPPGWYEIIATLPFPDFSRQSQAFYVQNGTDTSCINSTPASSSTTSDPTSPPASPTASSSSTISSSGGDGTLPVNGAASTSKVNRGAIAGGVIGGLAVIAAAIAAFFYFRYAAASSTSKGSPAKRGPSRRWAGLGSTDSKTNMYPSPSSRSAGASSGGSHRQTQTNSVGAMLDSNVYMIGNVGINSRPSRMNDTTAEEDEVESSFFSPSQEKISSSPPGRSPFSESGHGHEDAVALDYIAPLPGNSAVTRNSSTSTSSYMNSNFSRPRSHPSSPYNSPTSTEGPFSDSKRNTSSSVVHESSYPPAPSPAFPSGTSQTAAIERRGSAGSNEPAAAAAPPTRRTPRKPVPQYNPTDPSLTSPPASSPTPLPPVHDASDSSREGSLRGGMPGAPQLGHKSSFGDGRPVHYLIPDMPPPQRD